MLYEAVAAAPASFLTGLSMLSCRSCYMTSRSCWSVVTGDQNVLGGICLVCGYHHHQHHQPTTCTDPCDAAVQVGDRDCSKSEGRVPVPLNDARSKLAGTSNFQFILKLFVVVSGWVTASKGVGVVRGSFSLTGRALLLCTMHH